MIRSDSIDLIDSFIRTRMQLERDFDLLFIYSRAYTCTEPNAPHEGSSRIP